MQRIHNDWLESLSPEDQVWWNDPDCGISSGYYTVSEIMTEGEITGDTIARLKNEAGSEVEVFVSEMSATKPEGLFPVVDGSNLLICGHASSEEDAEEVAESCLNGEGFRAERKTGVKLENGEILPEAWLVTLPALDVERVRLVMDVTYKLNGETAQEMAARLLSMCRRAIGEGLLTGETDAEVEDYSISAKARPDLDEEATTEFLMTRMLNGDLRLEEIPSRMARYGLMEPGEFAEEMLERMEMSKGEGRIIK